MIKFPGGKYQVVDVEWVEGGAWEARQRKPDELDSDVMVNINIFLYEIDEIEYRLSTNEPLETLNPWMWALIFPSNV